MRKGEILAAFQKLDEELERQGICGEVGVVGGAAMVLAFNARAATKDVDAIFEPSSKMRKAIQAIAADLGLPEDWMNDAVKAFLPGEPKEKREIYSRNHLRVWVPEAEYLLAMKCISARFDTRDAEDLKLLIKKLKIKKSDEVFTILQKYYPKKQIPAKTQFFIEEVFDQN